MNKLNLILIATTTLVSSVVMAETPPKPNDIPMKPGMGMHHGHGMGGMMANMSEEQREEHLRGMQEHMLKMHELSTQILAEKDPAKKEQLKKQQLEMMKAHHTQMMEHHKMMKEPEKK